MSTIPQEETILTKNQFEVFVLLYAAHVDYEFSDDEKQFILNRTDQATFEKMYDYFLTKGDYTCMKIILKHKDDYYSSEVELENLFKLLKGIFEIDGDYSRIEKGFVQFFRKMIDIKWI